MSDGDEIGLLADQKSEEVSEWTNDDNQQFYEGMSLAAFQHHANLCGLNTCKDLDCIQPFLVKANSILELGAGYGRVIDGLLKRDYQGELFAVERNLVFYNLLKTQFEKKDVTIIQADIRNLSLKKKFDVALWLWSNIAEFSEEEQLPTIAKIISHVKSGGHLFIDTRHPDISQVTETYISKQQNEVITPSGTDHLYIPTEMNIKSYANQLSLDYKKIAYQPENATPRIMYIFTYD